MQIHVFPINKTNVAEVISDRMLIKETQDALDLMANCTYQGARKIMIRTLHLAPEFFDLKTGMAGEILQKFSNYNVELAIVGDFSKYTSKSLQDFILESNRMGRIHFVSTREEAKNRLANMQKRNYDL
jgi:hypothetical protein